MKLGLGLNVSSNVYHDNYSLLFNGSTQYVNCDTAAGDMNAASGTISAWVRISDAMSANGQVLKASTDSNNQLHLQYHNASEEWRFTYKAGGTVDLAVSSTTAEDTGDWVHVAMTWDASEDELKGYVNGTQVGGTKSSLGTWSGAINECYIGTNTLASNSFFKGNINEVSIFTNVADISKLYNGGNPVDVSNIPNLVGYYKFEEGSGTTTLDSSGTGNTGTLVNTPSWTTTVKL